MAFWDDLAAGSVEGLFKGFGELALDIRTAITGRAAVKTVILT